MPWHDLSLLVLRSGSLWCPSTQKSSREHGRGNSMAQIWNQQDSCELSKVLKKLTKRCGGPRQVATAANRFKIKPQMSSVMEYRTSSDGYVLKTQPEFKDMFYSPDAHVRPHPGSTLRSHSLFADSAVIIGTVAVGNMSACKASILVIMQWI